MGIFKFSLFLGVSAKLHKFDVTKYEVSLLFRTIKLGISASIIASPSRAI